jgi:hypothetical protein
VSQVRLSPRASAAEKRLQPKQRKKLAWWIARLKVDAFAGDQVPKDRIPPQLGSRSGLPSTPANAWRFELPLAFRGIYTVQSSPGTGTVVLILEILSHKEYDRLFGYR